MYLPRLVQNGKGWRWSDTDKNARIKREIGVSVPLDRTTIDDSLSYDASMIAAKYQLDNPGKRLPNGTEYAYHVEKYYQEEKLTLRVHVVEARR